MRIGIIALSLTGLLLGGCSNAPKVSEGAIAYNQDYSFGKNILYAASLPGIHLMKDALITKEQYETMQNNSRAINGAKNGAIIGGAAVALEMYSAVGFVSAGSILSSNVFHEFLGMGLLNGLLKPASPMVVDHLAMWMPKEMAKTEDEAKEKMLNIFLETHKKSIPAGYVFKENPEKKPDGRTNFNRFTATGGVCDKYGSDFRQTCSGSLKEALVTQELLLDNNYQPGFRPNYFDQPGQPAWVAYVRQGLFSNSITCGFDRKSTPTEEERNECVEYNKAYKSNFKKNLPDWVYFYKFDRQKGLGIVEQANTGAIFPLMIVEKK